MTNTVFNYYSIKTIVFIAGYTIISNKKKRCTIQFDLTYYRKAHYTTNDHIVTICLLYIYNIIHNV